MDLRALALLVALWPTGALAQVLLQKGDVEYRNGHYGLAAHFYASSAAFEHNAWAEYNLGAMYYRGLGLPQNSETAIQWLHRAAADPGMHDRAIGLLTVIANAQAAAQPPERKIEVGSSAASGATDQLLPTSAGMVEQTSVKTFVPLKNDNGTLLVPVGINGVMTLDFTVDSGAADVNIPEDVLLTLSRAGTVSTDDFLGNQAFTLADGTPTKQALYRIRSLKVGNLELQNVTASVTPFTGTLLLGQSFLSRFKTWSIDNSQAQLVLESNDAQP